MDLIIQKTLDAIATGFFLQELTEAHLGVAGLALAGEAAAGWGAAETRAGLLPSTTADRTHRPLRPGEPRSH